MATIYGLKNIGKTTLINHFSFRNKVNYLNANNAYTCIFSLSGYTDYVKENAGNIRLYTIEDMYQ